MNSATDLFLTAAHAGRPRDLYLHSGPTYILKVYDRTATAVLDPTEDSSARAVLILRSSSDSSEALEVSSRSLSLSRSLTEPSWVEDTARATLSLLRDGALTVTTDASASSTQDVARTSAEPAWLEASGQRQLNLPRSLSESWEFGEATEASRILDLARTASQASGDSTDAAFTVINMITREVSEATSETAAADRTADTRRDTATEITLVDSATQSAASRRAGSESVEVDLATSRVVDAQRTGDVDVPTDAVTDRVFHPNRTATEGAVLARSLARTLLRTFAADTGYSTIDTASRVLDLQRAGSEPVAVDASSSRALALARQALESLTLSEVAKTTRAANRSTAEATTSSASVASIVAFIRSSAASSSVRGTASRTLGSTRTAAIDLTLTAASNLAQALTRSLAEAWDVSDSSSRRLGVIRSTTGGTSSTQDTAIRVATAYRTSSETGTYVSLTPLAGSTLTRAITLTESLLVSVSSAMVKLRVSEVGLSAPEAAAVAVTAFSRSGSERLDVTSAGDRIGTYVRRATAVTAVTDSASRVLALTRLIGTAVTASESPQRLVDAARRATDLLETAAVLAQRALTQHRASLETTGLVETATRTSAVSRLAVELTEITASVRTRGTGRLRPVRLRLATTKAALTVRIYEGIWPGQ